MKLSLDTTKQQFEEDLAFNLSGNSLHEMTPGEQREEQKHHPDKNKEDSKFAEQLVGQCDKCGHYNDNISVCNCAHKTLKPITILSLEEAIRATSIGGKVNDDGELIGDSVSDTLKHRGNRYGKFSKHATVSQELKDVFYTHMNEYNHEALLEMPANQKEAIELIMHKLGRIANGDTNYDDNWRDISGYAQLIVDYLNGKDI